MRQNPARDDHDVRHDAPPQHQPFWSPRLLRSLSKRLSNTVFFLVSLRRRKSETNYRLGRPAVNRRVAKNRLNHQLVHHHQPQQQREIDDGGKKQAPGTLPA